MNVSVNHNGVEIFTYAPVLDSLGFVAGQEINDIYVWIILEKNTLYRESVRIAQAIIEKAQKEGSL